MIYQYVNLCVKIEKNMCHLGLENIQLFQPIMMEKPMKHRVLLAIKNIYNKKYVFDKI